MSSDMCEHEDQGPIDGQRGEAAGRSRPLTNRNDGR